MYEPQPVCDYMSVPLHPYPAFRSSCEQQSVHEDPAAAQHTEEAQETPTQRVLHRRLRGDCRRYAASQNTHLKFIYCVKTTKHFERLLVFICKFLQL